MGHTFNSVIVVMTEFRFIANAKWEDSRNSRFTRCQNLVTWKLTELNECQMKINFELNF